MASMDPARPQSGTHRRAPTNPHGRRDVRGLISSHKLLDSDQQGRQDGRDATISKDAKLHGVVRVADQPFAKHIAALGLAYIDLGQKTPYLSSGGYQSGMARRQQKPSTQPRLFGGSQESWYRAPPSAPSADAGQQPAQQPAQQSTRQPTQQPTHQRPWSASTSHASQQPSGPSWDATQLATARPSHARPSSAPLSQANLRRPPPPQQPSPPPPPEVNELPSAATELRAAAELTEGVPLAPPHAASPSRRGSHTRSPPKSPSKSAARSAVKGGGVAGNVHGRTAVAASIRAAENAGAMEVARCARRFLSMHTCSIGAGAM